MSWVIKEADKGSAIVIMDAEFYERKIKEMLHDTTMYEEIDNNKDRKTISLIRQLILNTESTLTDKEQDYLTKFVRNDQIFTEAFHVYIISHINSD